MTSAGAPVFGHHPEFVELYDDYVAAKYPPAGDGIGTGRWRLMRSIAHEMQKRKARRVLDCAAGTGFPMIDLASDQPGEFEIHCTDGDHLMIDKLFVQAKQRGLDASAFTPERWPGLPNQPIDREALVVDWNELGQLEGGYDYVLCRGNSLAYADTWGGRRHTASNALLKSYLERMVETVRPGGYLHVDAPHRMDLAAHTTSACARGTKIWEQVTAEDDCRQWWVAFKPEAGSTVVFKRYSSLLTIDRVETTLQTLGLETKRCELHGERAEFGVIIARRPR